MIPISMLLIIILKLFTISLTKLKIVALRKVLDSAKPIFNTKDFMVSLVKVLALALLINVETY